MKMGKPSKTPAIIDQAVPSVPSVKNQNRVRAAENAHKKFMEKVDKAKELGVPVSDLFAPRKNKMVDAVRGEGLLSDFNSIFKELGGKQALIQELRKSPALKERFLKTMLEAEMKSIEAKEKRRAAGGNAKFILMVENLRPAERAETTGISLTGAEHIIDPARDPAEFTAEEEPDEFDVNTNANG